MTKPTLTSSTLVRFNSTNNTVNNESFNVQGNLFYFHVPATNPTEPITELLESSFNIALLPKKSVITISGEYKGDNEADIKAFIEEIENQVNSPTQSRRTYTNAVKKTYGVKINIFNYNHTPNTNKVDYSMELFVQSL